MQLTQGYNIHFISLLNAGRSEVSIPEDKSPHLSDFGRLDTNTEVERLRPKVSQLWYREILAVKNALIYMKGDIYIYLRWLNIEHR